MSLLEVTAPGPAECDCELIVIFVSLKPVGYIGNPAASILLRKSLARTESSELPNNALISAGRASNCSARSLMR